MNKNIRFIISLAAVLCVSLLMCNRNVRADTDDILEIIQTTPELTSELTPEPVPEPTPEPIPDPTPEPISEPILETVNENITVSSNDVINDILEELKELRKDVKNIADNSFPVSVSRIDDNDYQNESVEDTVSRNIINTRLQDYTLHEQLQLLVLIGMMCAGIVYLIHKAIYKWG